MSLSNKKKKAAYGNRMLTVPFSFLSPACPIIFEALSKGKEKFLAKARKL